MPEPPVDTLDPEALKDFLADLAENGFTADADRRIWSGPLPEALRKFATATTMQIVLRDGWPYLPPQTVVEGIHSWHADHDRLCLWQPGDNTRMWMTYAGILKRIGQWVKDAQAGFAELGASLDPHLHFDALSVAVVGVDVERLVGGAYQDGQHGRLHLTRSGLLWVVEPGRPPPRLQGKPVEQGRWFYRQRLDAPPRHLDDFTAALTDKQRRILEGDLQRLGRGIFALLWTTTHGVAVLMLAIDASVVPTRAEALTPTPISRADRLRRAGPDAALLAGQEVTCFGLGAIGSHLASLLARSGTGQLRLIDGDRLWPVNLVRHAATPAAVGAYKAEAMQYSLQEFDWADVTVDVQGPWSPAVLHDQIKLADLVVDATGFTPFAELLSRVAEGAGVPMISVALYRGGAVVRVRRQAEGDQPLTARRGHWRYPTIPAGKPEEETLGVETGCDAPISNASPAAIAHAAALAARVAIDQLTGRRQLPDEIIEVLTPVEEPLHRIGTLTATLPAIQLTEDAAQRLRRAAAAAHPNETGGILVGVHDAVGGPVVVDAVELAPAVGSPQRFDIPADATTPAVERARREDPRVGYLGEWHTHPSDQPASLTDVATMLELAAAEGTGSPALIVVRPTASDESHLDGYLADHKGLHQVGVMLVGPLNTPDG